MSLTESDVKLFDFAFQLFLLLCPHPNDLLRVKWDVNSLTYVNFSVYLKGIYDLHIEVQGVPLLPWEPPELSYTLTARLAHFQYCEMTK